MEESISSDEAVERPRFGPTGHGGGALRVPALRRAPGARSLSAVFGGPCVMNWAPAQTERGPSRLREYAVLCGFAAALTVATVSAAFDGLSCDTIPADDFLCGYDRLRLTVRLLIYLGVALVIARQSSAIVRTVRPWCAVPFAVVIWCVVELGRFHPELTGPLWSRGGLLLGWAIGICSVLAFRRRPAETAASVRL